jgi:uncharacterized membrane protein
MSRHLSVISNLLIVLQVFLLVFCFVDLSVLPPFVLFAGRFHPLVLHLPITLIILLVPFSIYLQRRKDTDDLTKVFELMLSYIALISTLTAIAGFLLAADGGYDQETLSFHKWLGVAVAFSTHALVYIKKAFGNNPIVWNTAMSTTLIVMVAGSHFGGNLTHGEGFFTFKKEIKPEIAIAEFTDRTTIYEGAVQPILAAKCVVCHNDQKTKGGLNMKNLALMLKGGKTGAMWVSGDPDKSLMIERMLLDMDNKEHMPPKGKAQLSSAEIHLFQEWIRAGADAKKTYHALAETDTLKKVIGMLIAASPRKTVTKTYDFPAVSQSAIQKLNSPFRRILPLSANSPALSVKFFLKEKFDISLLKECKEVSEQIVELTLAGMPVGDEVFQIISTFPNLEILNLNTTSITGNGLKELLACKKLEQLSVTSTTVGTADLSIISTLGSLKRVFIWNTKVTDADALALKKKSPKINWDMGYVPDKNELLKLTAPQPLDAEKMVYASDELIGYKHPMPGVQIRYTIDGSNPDSLNSLLYKRPFQATGLMRVRTIATSQGWLTSDTTDKTYFLKGFQPDSVVLTNNADKQYKGLGARTLIDLVKGSSGNLNQSWLGFRDNSFKAGFYFSKGEEIKEVFLSTVESIDGYVFPAKKIIVKGGDSPKSLKVLKIITPEQPKEKRRKHLEPFVMPVDKQRYKYIEIEAIPVGVLPRWHPGKGEKAWVFVDEVFFY